jgi:hypothetical protein
MEDIPETLTRDLHDRLAHRFAGSAQTCINVAYDCCFVKCMQRSCAVSCDHIPRLEYMTSFEQEWKEMACGRTPSQAEAIEAVWDWLNDTPLEALYSRYRSVDLKKRELVRIRDLVLKDFPDLDVATQIELEHLGFDVYHLWCRSETRSAEIYDNSAPSTVRQNFPWLKIDKLGDYYEHGNPVEGEFLRSWDGIE